MNNRLTLNDMAIFATIVKYKSFTKASADLEIAKSTISIKLSKLEELLDTKLINRTTRSMSLTKAGEILLKHCNNMLEEAALAEANLKHYTSNLSGKLKISHPEITGQFLLPNLITEFQKQYPKVEIEVIVSDQFVDILNENIDFSFRTGVLKDSGLIARKIGSEKRCMVASPSYLKNSPLISCPNDLSQHMLLKHSQMINWPLQTKEDEFKYQVKNVNFSSNSLLLIFNMSLAGNGIALVPYYLASPYIKTNVLELVLPSWNVTTDNYYLIYNSGNHNNLLHKSFKDFIITSNLSNSIEGAE